MRTPTLFGLTSQQRTRIALAAFLAEDIMIGPGTGRANARLLGIQDWVVDLADALDTYTRLGERCFDHEIITIRGAALVHRTRNGRESHSLYWPLPEEPTTAALYVWALRRAACTHSVLDPSVTRDSAKLLCSAAGIASLDVLRSEILDHHLAQELVHV